MKLSEIIDGYIQVSCADSLDFESIREELIDKLGTIQVPERVIRPNPGFEKTYKLIFKSFRQVITAANIILDLGTYEHLAIFVSFKSNSILNLFLHDEFWTINDICYSNDPETLFILARLGQIHSENTSKRAQIIKASSALREAGLEKYAQL